MPGTMRVYLISDIHTDYDENLEWIRDLSSTTFLDDVLIVAGDVTDSIPLFEETFRILRPKFAHVFFTPGNHDLWLRSNGPPLKPAVERDPKPPSETAQNPDPKLASEQPPEPDSKPASEPKFAAGLEEVTTPVETPVEDSISKLRALFRICEELGVETRPKFLVAKAGSGRNNGVSSAPRNDVASISGKSGDIGKNGTGSQQTEVQREVEGCRHEAQNGRGAWQVDLAASGSVRRDVPAEQSAELRQTEGAVSDSTDTEKSFRTAATNESGKSPTRVDNGASKSFRNWDDPLESGSSERAGTSLSQGGRFAGESRGGRSENAPRVNGLSCSDAVDSVLQPGVASVGVGRGQSISYDQQSIGYAQQQLTDAPRENGNGTEDGRDGFRKGSEEGSCAGVWVVPILSWHHMSFDTEPDIPGYKIPPIQKVAKDYKVCKWPPGWDPLTDSVAHEFDAMNAELHRDFDPAATPGCHVITFSHFLLRLELIPEKRFLFYPNLAKAVGSHALEARVRAIHRDAGTGRAIHAFGHTHFNWDATLDGIRYVQAPLAYPRERKRRMNGGEEWLPLCLSDSSRGGVLAEEVPCHWSEYYKTHPREPENFEFAHWVANLWKPIRKEGETVAK